MKPAPLLICLLSILTASVTNMPKQTDELLQSRAERTNYEETSRYEDVIRFIDELQKRSGRLRVESFGLSEEGRDLPLMILADPPVTQPREARESGKPVIFVMANIHAGEVEGKEAMINLSRRLLTGDLRPLLKNLIILIAPIYNADGNEKISPTNRSAQNGPVGGVGTRENAKGMDLNRDYMKLESIEANALIDLFNRWDPHLSVDLHTTNGSYHGYHLTYSPTLNPNADSRLIAFERNRMLPAITRTLLRKHGFRVYFYGNFATKDRMNRELNTFEMQRSGRAAEPAAAPGTRIWRTFDHRPMFGNNYVGLRNRMTILSEAYSYLDFRGRIAVTESFVEEILNYSSAHAAEILSLIKRADRTALEGRIEPLGVDFEMASLEKPVNILVGEVTKVKNPRSGRDMTAMIPDKFTAMPMPDYGIFKATKTVPVPKAYIFENQPGLKPVIDKLRAHGIAVEELTRESTIEVESFVITSVNKAPRAFQGHQEIRLKGTTKTVSQTFPAGSILVRTTQSPARLIFYLLEPESDNGLVRWNFLDAYLEKSKTYPIYKLISDAGLAGRVLR
ncbi:MAG: M14 family metallopeptidase [Acidobacteriota bacterium]|nr:MAG: M14 family metallopeptidase [Acidobacteriota bacterium]